MRIEQLEYIIEIADSGSISTAAEKLHISQPSISQSLASLEEELNTTIFHRTRLGTQPTEAGKQIIEKARQIVNMIGEISKIEESQLTGSLTITFIPSLGMTILPKALGVFKNKYPGVKFNIYEEGSVLAEEKVLEGKVDIALVANYEGKEYDNRLNFIPLLKSEVRACVSQLSPFADQTEISLAEIVNHPIVTFNEKYNIRSLVLSMLKPYGEPNIFFNFENFEVAKKVILENLAIGFNTSLPLRTDPSFLNGMLILLPIKERKDLSLTHGILLKKNIHLTLVAQKFIEELQNQATNFKKQYTDSL